MEFSKMPEEWHDEQTEALTDYLLSTINEAVDKKWGLRKKDIKALVRTYNFFVTPDKRIKCEFL